jgi:hypothetical protein
LVPEFYHGLAPTWEQFLLVDKARIPDIIAYLRTQPSLLDPYAQPVSVDHLRGSGQEIYQIHCNYDGVSCAVAGSIKFMDQGTERYAVIWELKDGNGPKQYIAEFIYDSVENSMTRNYGSLVKYPTYPRTLRLYAAVPPVDIPNYPYSISLTQQPGYQEAVRTLLETQNVPPQLQDGSIIIPGDW